MARLFATGADTVGGTVTSLLNNYAGVQTYAGWCMVASTPANGNGFLPNATYGGTRGVGIATSGAQNGAGWGLIWWGQASLNTNDTLSLNSWHHLAVVYDGVNNWACYRDGTFITNLNHAFSTPPTTGDQILTSHNNVGGTAADTAIWKAALSGASIAALAQGARPIYVNSANLVLWWPITGLQSPEPDLSGNANNGTVTATTPAFGPPFMQFTPRRPQFLVQPPPASILFAQACL